MKSSERTVQADFDKFNMYIKEHSDTGTLNITEFMYYLHPVYPHLATEQKEKIVIDTLRLFPQTQAYAILKIISDKLDLQENYPDEYKKTHYGEFVDDIETELIVGFGDANIFLTYAKLYCPEVSRASSALGEKVRRQFFDLKVDNHSWIKMA